MLALAQVMAYQYSELIQFCTANQAHTVMKETASQALAFIQTDNVICDISGKRDPKKVLQSASAMLKLHGAKGGLTKEDARLIAKNLDSLIPMVSEKEGKDYERNGERGPDR